MQREGIIANNHFEINRLKPGRLHSRLINVLLILLFCLPLFLLTGTADAQPGFYSICFGSYKNKNYAAEAVSRLKKKNYNAFLTYEEIQGKGKYYRAYVGKFNSKIEAEKKAGALVDLEIISDYFINVLSDIKQVEISDAENSKLRYYLHVSSFKKRLSAEKEVRRFLKHGYEAIISEEKIEEKNWFRVYLGPFENKKDARSAGTELKKNEIISFYALRRKDQIFDKAEQAASSSSFIPLEQAVERLGKNSETKEEGKTADKISKDSSIEEYNERKTGLQEISPADILETGHSIQITDVLFIKNQMGIEIVQIHANRFFDPDILYVESDNPRIFIDIQDAVYIKRGFSKIEANGALIRTIRPQTFGESNKFRLILDLVSDENYSMDHFFYKKENIYSLFVRKKDTE